MFFGTSEVSVQISSVIAPSWDGVDRRSGVRPFHALSYRICGNAEFTSGQKVSRVGTGDVVFVPAGCEYALRAGKEQLVVVHFSSVSTLPEEIRRFCPKDTKYFERKFRELHAAWTKKQFGYQLECKSILFRIMTKIERELAEIKISDSSERILEAVEYMHDHFADREITVEQLAAMCAMSDTYFRKLFVKNFSVTPLRYINQLKVAYAKELFASGYYTVSQIAQKCGFESIYYFSAFIKRETGKAPSAFLQKNALF